MMVLPSPDIASANMFQDFAWQENELTMAAFKAQTQTPARYFVDLNSFVNIRKKSPSWIAHLRLDLAVPATSLSTEYANGLV